MKIVIDIPENEVSKRREIVEIVLQFMDGEVCECTFPFQVFPKGHGRLIDADYIKLFSIDHDCWNDVEYEGVIKVVPVIAIDNASTIIEADKEEEE